jgi:hypothetical protein
MSARALEFVETWVTEKIEELEELPGEDDEKTFKTMADECLKAALEDGIPAAEIQEQFDDLAEFIGGEVEEARERREGKDEDEDDDEELFVDEEEEDE